MRVKIGRVGRVIVMETTIIGASTQREDLKETNLICTGLASKGWGGYLARKEKSKGSLEGGIFWKKGCCIGVGDRDGDAIFPRSYPNLRVWVPCYTIIMRDERRHKGR